MTDDEIKAARALCEAATPGPWAFMNEAYPWVAGAVDEDIACPSTVIEFNECGEQAHSDARFIAAARTLLPAALDALEQARRERDEARAHAAERGAAQVAALSNAAVEGVDLDMKIESLTAELAKVTAERDVLAARAHRFAGLPVHVDQTTFGFPGGNCFSACIATLLGLPLADVPYFMEPEDWWDGFLEWLRPRGLYALCFPLKDQGWRPPGYHVLSGRSPRRPDDPNAHHSVVARGDEIIHDPHPSRDGLLAHLDVIVLIPMLPRAPR